MIKRVVCVLALLVGSIAYGQEELPHSSAVSSSTRVGGQPVVTVVSATGSVITTTHAVLEKATTTPPAEGEVAQLSTTTRLFTETEHGAVSTSSTSTVATSSEATGVVETQSIVEENEDKLDRKSVV